MARRNTRRGVTAGWNLVRIDLENLGVFTVRATTIEAYLPGLDWALSRPIIHWSQVDHDGGSFGPSTGLHFLMKHLADCESKGGHSPLLGSMLETLLMTARGRPSDIGSLNDRSHISSVLSDLGRLLRPDNCGLTSYIFHELTVFFKKNYLEIAAEDDLLFLVMIAAFCEMTADDMSLQAPFVGLIQQSQDALEILSEYISDSYWSNQYIISDELLLALSLQHPSTTMSRHVRRNRMGNRFRNFQNAASTQWPQPFTGSPSLWPPLARAQFNRRHGLTAHSSNYQGIKGSYLPLDYLQQLAITNPDAIKVDSRALGQNFQMMSLMFAQQRLLGT